MRSSDACSKCRVLVALCVGIAGLALAAAPPAAHADEAREILLRRISTLRGQIQSLDAQIGELQRKMPALESGIDALLEEIGSLKAPEPEDKKEEVEEPAAKPRQQGFRPPLLRAVQKDTPIVIVCQNGRAAILDIDEMGEAFKAIKDDRARLDAFVRSNGGTLPAGDFQVKVTLLILGPSVLIQQEVVTPSGTVGETLQEALLPASKLNQRLGRIDGEKAVIQFFVYPDSFEVFREVRKVVWKGNFSVNWIPRSHGDKMNLGSGGPSAQ